MFNQGDTFLAGEELHGKHHLWVVINEPAKHGGKVLIVNVTELRPGAETTCILKSGEHPFINKDSYVRFKSAHAPQASDLVKLQKAGKIVPHHPASQALLAKIRAGAAASLRLPPACRTVL